MIKKISKSIKSYFLVYALLLAPIGVWGYAFVRIHLGIGFLDATSTERRQIEEFYAFQPEMISKGRVFDLKLMVTTQVVSLTVDDKSPQTTMYYSVLKKTVMDIEFETTMEFYSKGKLVDLTCCISPVEVTFATLHNMFYRESPQMPRGNKYFVPMMPIQIYSANVSEPTLIDEVVIKFTYFGGEEVHRLKFDSEKSSDLVMSIMESDFNNPNEDLGHLGYINETYNEYLDKLYVADVDAWLDFMTAIVEDAEASSSSLGAHLINNHYTMPMLNEYQMEFVSKDKDEEFSLLVQRIKVLSELWNW